MKQKLIYFFATGFGAGLIPFAPGTMGTLVAIPFYIGLQKLSLIAYAILLILSFIIGIWLCSLASKPLATHDHPSIVWDEMVGFWLTLFAIPFSLLNLFIGFLAFRLFDIQKPWPIGWVDKKVQGGLGIMLDDVLAGIYANLTLQIFVHFMQ
jgi:phosphatidylglycerophosphatase A